jgi:ribosomal protein S18 acetylase RimI-like enzyme
MAVDYAMRPARREDVSAIRPIVDSTLFPGEMLDEMIAPYLDAPYNTDIWFVCERDGVVRGVGFCEAERMTVGTWNLLAIAVEPAMQSQGAGAAMMAWLEARLAKRGERVLIVETSGLPEYARTRDFYARIGYTGEARIRDFYQHGEDKIVFWKALQADQDSSST